MKFSTLARCAGVAVLVITASCGKRQATRQPTVTPPECRILAPAAGGADTVVVALLNRVNPALAPWARNADEQLVFHHFYETLIVIDCNGEVRPALAMSWARHDGGRRWTFDLQESARFWDGAQITANDVKRSWENMALEPLELYAVVDSVVVEGTHRVHVLFEKRQRSIPRALASPPFAVTKSGGSSRWLVGTGAYTAEATPGGLIARSKACVLRFVVAGTRDPRDMLEGDVDLMLTTDPQVLGYAERREHLTTLALPWDRTYVLVSASRVESLHRGERVGEVPEALTDAFARDAVRVDARGYRGRSWWSSMDDCGDLVVGMPGAPPIPTGAFATGQKRVVYDSADPIARDLAQRIVALAVADPGHSPDAVVLAAAVPGLAGGESGIIAHGTSDGEVALSLWSGDDFAYVIAVPRLTPDPCYAARQLANRAPWLARSSPGLEDVLIPLVDTRSHVIARRDRVALIADGLGNIIVSNGVVERK